MEYDNSPEYRNDGGGKPKARRAKSEGMTLAQKRRERSALIETATRIFCARLVNEEGRALSIDNAVDRAAVLMWRATEKVEEYYGEKASKKLPQVPK